MIMLSLLLGVAIAAASPYVVAPAFGHGLGADQAPPINFEGMDVTVRTALTPSDITAGEIDDANMNVKFFDTLTDKNLDKVTYRIDIYRSGDLLARELFYDDEGNLDVEVRPILSCGEIQLWKCSKYLGERHPIAGALFARGEGRPIIQGPIFDKGGLYNIQVTIEGATSPKSLVAKPLSFETFVSVAQKQDFVIQTAHAEEVPVVVKTYYDDILSLDYSTSNHAITFDMPFDWSPEYVSLVQLVHEEVQIPKSFEPYNVNDFRGYVNGIEVRNRQLAFDPYSKIDAGSNIIHFVVTGDELARINGLLGPSNHGNDRMIFELVPLDNVVRNSEEFYLVDPGTGDRAGSTVNISWDAKYGAGDSIPFKFIFYDESGNRLYDVKYAYYVYDEDDDNKLLASGGDDNLGLETFEGMGIQNIAIPSQKQYRIDVWLLGQGLDLNQTYAGVGSVRVQVGQPSSAPPGGTVNGDDDNDDRIGEPAPPSAARVQIPGWVKSNAGLWSGGQIDDATFAAGIEYMVQKGVVTVPPTAGEKQQDDMQPNAIPSWVRTNAGMWSGGQIDDATFAAGLQWLIANGIITVGTG